MAIRNGIQCLDDTKPEKFSYCHRYWYTPLYYTFCTTNNVVTGPLYSDHSRACSNPCYITCSMNNKHGDDDLPTYSALYFSCFLWNNFFEADFLKSASVTLLRAKTATL